MAISTAEMNADVLARLATKHLQEQLEVRIRNDLMAVASEIVSAILSEIVSQIARDTAASISAQVHSYQDFNGDVHVRLVFNGQDVEWRSK
jgi:hypothetical protein